MVDNKKRNLVFIMTDHQRADSIGMVQDGKEVTPNLNNLCKEAVNFTKAYTTCPLCVPARTALATGKFPVSNGVVINQPTIDKVGDYDTIHQYLKNEGYSVGHVGMNHIRVNPELKERTDFDFWIDEYDYQEYAEGKGIKIERDSKDVVDVIENFEGTYTKKGYSGSRVSKWDNNLVDFKDQYFKNKSIEYLEANKEKPFALFVYLWAPHPPLQVPKEYFEMFNPDNLILPENLGVIPESEPKIRTKGIARQMAQNVPFDYWKHVWSASLGLTNMADQIVGEILDKVKGIGQEDNTMILFTADHGDHLGQRLMYQKMEMYEQAINIPLIMKVPGGCSNEFDIPVSHLDILPTVLDVLNIEIPKNIDGKSLKNSVINNEEPEEKEVYCQYSGNPKIGDIRRAVISKNFKYIYDAMGECELYDLVNDPLEMNNLACGESHAHIIKDMHNMCKIFGLKQSDFIEY